MNTEYLMSLLVKNNSVRCNFSKRKPFFWNGESNIFGTGIIHLQSKPRNEFDKYF